jgi:hypothetical protein
MTVLRVNTIAGTGTTFGPTLDGNLEFNSQNYIVLPKGTSTQEGVLRNTTDVVGTGGTYYDNLVLAMPFNEANGFRDVSSRNRNPAAYGNVAISTAQSKYYGSSAYFDGSTSQLTSPFSANGDFDFGSGNFTIEGWINPLVSTRTGIIAANNGSQTASALIPFQIETTPSSGNLLLVLGNGSSAFTVGGNSVGLTAINQWYHFAAVRNGTNVSLYLNGVAVGINTAVTGSLATSGVTNLYVGQLGFSTGYFNGYLQDLRIYKGLAKYTANFTPPERIAELGVGFKAGQLRYNTDSNKVELYDGNQWTEVQASRPDLNGGARGLFGGGFVSPGSTNTINYINISSTSNSQDFGDLIEGRSTPCSCSSSTRGVWAGGVQSGYSNTIDFVTIASTGNAQDFGDLNAPARRILGGCSSSTRGLFGGGYQGPGIPAYNIIDYITISATGNAVDFGDLTVGRYGLASFSSPVRGVWAGGYGAPSYRNTIDYVTISTLGNATDFGDVGVSSYYLSGCANTTRGLYTEGIGVSSGIVNTISYVTIASTGNGVKFGDLTTRRWTTSACSSSTRGVFAGGYDTSPTPAGTNIIDYVSILTQGSAVDFGDLINGNYGYTAGCSNAHGGL